MKLISARVAIALTLAVGGPAAASDIFRYECGAARSVPPAKDDPDRSTRL